MRYFLLGLLVTLISSTFIAQNKTMKIEFLGMKDGCPNTPKMWKSLNEALNELHWQLPVDSLDVIELSKNHDARAGFGSPTILINGKDIFGATPSESLNPACRYYRGGVPGTKEIAEKLRAFRR